MFSVTQDVYVKGICSKMKLIDNSCSRVVASSSNQGNMILETRICTVE